jgi:putative transposase
MNVLHDVLANGRLFRVLTMVYQWSRQSRILEVALSMSDTPSVRPWIRRSGAEAPGGRTRPDHGTEFMSRVLQDTSTRGERR